MSGEGTSGMLLTGSTLSGIDRHDNLTLGSLGSYFMRSNAAFKDTLRASAPPVGVLESSRVESRSRVEESSRETARPYRTEKSADARCVGGGWRARHPPHTASQSGGNQQHDSCPGLCRPWSISISILLKGHGVSLRSASPPRANLAAVFSGTQQDLSADGDHPACLRDRC